MYIKSMKNKKIRRTEKIEIRINELERELIEKLSEYYKLSKSEVIRYLIRKEYDKIKQLL